LTCKYHGWSYNHEGELLSVRDPEDFADLDFSCRALKSVRCELFGNLIFVNFDEAAPTLLEWLGPIALEWKEFQFDKCRLAARHIFDLECNWKIAMEANTEVYHVRSIHPTTVAPILDDRRNVNTFYPNGHGRMIAPRPGKTQGMMQQRNPDVSEFDTVGEIGRTCTQSYGIFPNWVSPLSPYALPPLLFWPNGINKSRLETWTFAPDWGEGPGPDMWTENNGEKLVPVLLEDTEFGAWIQKSVESYGFTGVPLSYQEARIYYWHQSADQIIGVDNIPPELRVPPVIGEDWIYPNDPRRALL
jgi:phenylpropionate dioxygenase-like ring-hydroxylating dioxygenase large terminal subunit